MNHKKTVLLCVTGGVAAYKAAAVASGLVKRGYCTHALLTKNATQFIGPITFESLTGNRCPVDTFDRNFSFEVEHISLASQADLVLVAPATANVIAKLAHGLADDMLTTTVLACRCPKLIAPAMNSGMMENPVTRENLETLRRFGWTVIEPAVGRLACGTVGTGKLPEPEELLSYVDQELSCEKDMRGLKVLITAGPTQEAIDPVRYITNHSTGKMGYALAANAARRGACVTLISGPVSLAPPPFAETVSVVSAQDMFEAVAARFEQQDVIIKAAAVADYRPDHVQSEKMKKSDGETALSMVRTPDILQYLGGHRRPGQFLCGFSMETQELVENSRKKLIKKKADMIAANNLKVEGAGFGGSTNVLTLLTAEDVIPLPLLSKEEAAAVIFDEIMKRRKK